MGQKVEHGMLMLLHDSMPSFMNFRLVLDLLEFKNQASQCFAVNQQCPGVWNSFPFLAWTLACTQVLKFDFSTNLYALEHVHVVWILVIFRGLFGHFYALTEFSMLFMCIIQIWTTCTCSSAYKLVEKSNLCPWCMIMSHARNGMNFKHQGTLDCQQNIEILYV